jgi:hypothetical protein
MPGDVLMAAIHDGARNNSNRAADPFDDAA